MGGLRPKPHSTLLFPMVGPLAHATPPGPGGKEPKGRPSLVARRGLQAPGGSGAGAGGLGPRRTRLRLTDLPGATAFMQRLFLPNFFSLPLLILELALCPPASDRLLPPSRTLRLPPPEPLHRDSRHLHTRGNFRLHHLLPEVTMRVRSAPCLRPVPVQGHCWLTERRPVCIRS